MAEPHESTLSTLALGFDDEQLGEWLCAQRWFASKSQTLAGIEMIELAEVDESLALALNQVRLASGAHELYQMVLGQQDGELMLDALANPACALTLLRAVNEGRELDGLHGRFSFRHVQDDAASAGLREIPDTVRPIGVEQSNSSFVFGERLVLKLFRRLESGINPELEMLRFLTARGYRNIAPLYGWYEYEGDALAGTLGVVQQFVADGTDGWQLALAEIPSAPDRFLERLASLGTDTARMHSVLATDPDDPAFSPEEPSSESMSLLIASVDEDVERVFAHLPDDPETQELAGLGQRVRERIASFPQFSSGGHTIRIHGDYHLGQVLHSQEGWTLLDFEGEPARPLTVRRGKRSPLRDVASMLRSFSYATWAVKLQLGLEAPSGFEERAREAFLDAYLAEVDRTLLPGGEAQIENLLAIFELEKAAYELRYELDNRPEWVSIPVAGITRIVESE